MEEKELHSFKVLSLGFDVHLSIAIRAHLSTAGGARRTDLSVFTPNRAYGAAEAGRWSFSDS